jgi:sugar lactone lactonase YvrE
VAEVECVWPLTATLGEGPVWVERDAALWFVDIKGLKIHRFEPASGATRSWDAPDQPGFLLPAAGGGFVAGLKSGLHRFDPESGAFSFLMDPEPQLPGNRMNDASVAPDGTLWFGSMDDGEEADSGAFYRLGADGSAEPRGGECCITNGPAFSPDGRIFYHTDTIAGTIWAADVAEDGTLSNRRPFAEVDPVDGHPDGSTVDSEGCLWIGLWGGWRARRYAPDGSILTEVRLPAANVTKIAFGGPDLRTAFATTARKGLDDAALADQPLAGGLFAFDPGVTGLATPQFAG